MNIGAFFFNLASRIETENVFLLRNVQFIEYLHLKGGLQLINHTISIDFQTMFSHITVSGGRV